MINWDKTLLVLRRIRFFMLKHIDLRLKYKVKNQSSSQSVRRYGLLKLNIYGIWAKNSDSFKFDIS